MKKIQLIIACILGWVISNAQNIDSLNSLLKVAKSDKIKIELNRELALAYSNDGKGNKAIKCYQEILKITPKTDVKAEIYNEIGNVLADMGENGKAIAAYQNGLKLNYDKNLSLSAKINKNIGAVFLSWKKLDEALKHYIIAEEFAKQSKDERTLADLSNNKGTVFEQKNQFAEADRSYKKALNYYLREKINDRICLTYNNLAILYKVQNQLRKSAGFYKKAVEYAAKANNKWLTAALGNNYGNLLSEMGNYKESNEVLLSALVIEKEISAGELLPETLENLANNEKRKGNFEQAFDYQKQAASENKKFINIENTKEVARLQEEYEAQNRQKQIQILNKESKIQQLTLQKKNNTILLILGIATAAIVFSLLLFNRYNIQQRNKLKLASVESKNEIQEEKLRISRELHDNIGSQLTFINNSLQSYKQENGETERLNEAQQITTNTIRELRRTVWLINQPEFGLDEFVVKLREYVRPFENGKPKVEMFANDFTEQIVLQPIVATNLFRVIQEAINNALKYSEAHLLKIIMDANNETLTVTIEDNGKGFDVNLIESGYGLKNMKARIEQLKGEFTYKSKPLEGTIVQFSIKHI